VLSDDVGTAEIRCVDSTGDCRWVQTISARTTDAAALVVHRGKLYAALYSRYAAGCRVLTLDASSGHRLWETRLTGVGSVMHSKYMNRVQMRMKGKRLVVFGDESGGRYIEVLDPLSGRSIHNRRLKRGEGA
jgi:outer membrane protein assembly factor BamB